MFNRTREGRVGFSGVPDGQGRRSGAQIAQAAGPRMRSAYFRNAFAILLVGFALLSSGLTATAEGAAQLDLNRATAAQLEALPGIGAVKAAAILAVREERGGFQQVGELESVRGIGPALVAKLQPLVIVRAPDARKSKSTRTAKK